MGPLGLFLLTYVEFTPHVGFLFGMEILLFVLQ